MTALDLLNTLEAEAIHIVREALTSASNPLLLFSAGKDSAVQLHLVLDRAIAGQLIATTLNRQMVCAHGGVVATASHPAIGLDSPYEPPGDPQIRVDTTAMTAVEAADRIARYLLRELGTIDD